MKKTGLLELLLKVVCYIAYKNNKKSNLTTVIESQVSLNTGCKHVYFSCKIWHFNMGSYRDNLEPASSGF